ncbi:amidohydrolase [Pseudonocardia sp. C8]|uniref:amidohydrolase n=1 Tax=Pseudonocardia sp. C8 TaxID=2762759 RepID=UPI0016428E66|nr:amidohydrolase [Pseudonocardia sp. C8]MBC3192818.1 amidohydrolase [Pseudonocardia sp. C8]
MTATTSLGLDDAVARTIEDRAARLVEISHTIHATPELAFSEHRAAALLADEAERAGFTVTRGAYGLDTAFEAVRGTGPFRVVVCAEYDALPEIGHACGHNVIAAAGLGAALALAEVADTYGLTVVLLGTPAEEHGGGKVLLLERGAWAGATLSLMVHGNGGDDVSCTVSQSQAVDRFDVTFTGRAAHAAAAPHKAVNAGDAATVALVAIGLLRQQLTDGVRLHAYVANGGEATNIIPAETVLRAEVRAFDSDTLDDAKRRMLACFEAGAVATGCEWSHERAEPRYEELVQHPFLATTWDEQVRALGRDPVTDRPRSGGSTDMGNVTRVVPGIHPMIAFRGSDAVPHTVEFAADACGPGADEAVLHGAVAMARTVIAAASGAARDEFLALAADRAAAAS